MNAPGGTLAVGQLTMRNWFGPSGSPRLTSVAATATGVTALLEVCTSHREAKATAASPARMAMASIVNARLSFMAVLLASRIKSQCAGRYQSRFASGGLNGGSSGAEPKKLRHASCSACGVTVGASPR